MKIAGTSAAVARCCIPTWSYDAAFYDSLVAGTDVTIRTDSIKGKGLFAKRNIVEGSIIIEETALSCSQNMDDMVNGIPVCLHCLTSLETPRRVVARVARSKKLALDLPFARVISPNTPVACLHQRTGCTAQFCSARCREVAWERYHAVLCQGRMSSEQSEAYSAFLCYDWVQNGVDYSDTAILGLRIISQMLCRHRMHGMSTLDAFAPFAQLINAPLDKFFFTYLLAPEGERADDWGLLKTNPLALPGVADFYKSCSRTKQCFLAETLGLIGAVFSLTAAERDFWTASRWADVLGAVLLNGQERGPPSHYELLRDAVQQLPQECRELLSQYEAGLGEAAVREGLSHSARGQGIYTVGCLFNHSCEPNAQVIYGSANDETLAVVAMRDIAADEEIHISYIDEQAPRAERQRHLYEHYLFECECPKCSREVHASLE